MNVGKKQMRTWGTSKGRCRDLVSVDVGEQAIVDVGI